MRLATLADGTADGKLIVVSRDGKRFLEASAIAPTLQCAIERWEAIQTELRTLGNQVDAGSGARLEVDQLLAPLPRAWQWLDGSAFPQHGLLMQKAFNAPPVDPDRPLMYQGLSHEFLSGRADVPLPSENDGIDFEAEFGVVLDAVPMGTRANDALSHIKLLLLINDWSLRNIGVVEMRTGFGWIQAKPACSVAPFAVTPDELGSAWASGKIDLPVEVRLNGEWFGKPNGSEMKFSFCDLIAHAARTRNLPAGTIIGSGTVSNHNYNEVGSTCISERRAIETISVGAPETPFMAFGDRIEMNVDAGSGSVFGSIDQRVIQAQL